MSRLAEIGMSFDELGDDAEAHVGVHAGRCSGERLVMFDAESLLLDPSRGMQHALRCAVRDAGIALPADAFRHWSLRTPLRSALSILLQREDAAQLDSVCADYFRHYDAFGRFLCTLRPGSTRLLAQLASDPRFELHYLTHTGASVAARMLEVYGIQHLVRSVMTTEQHACPGVRPMLMRQLVDHSGRPPSSWVLLSDHPLEILSAQALHVRTIALSYGRAPLPTLCQVEPGAIAADLFEVEQQLRALLPADASRWVSASSRSYH